MITLNQAFEQANGAGAEPAANDDQELFGLQEAVTKLWTASVLRKDKAEIGKRVANVLIGLMINANRLGITDIEYEFKKRKEEFSRELLSRRD